MFKPNDKVVFLSRKGVGARHKAYTPGDVVEVVSINNNGLGLGFHHVTVRLLNGEEFEVKEQALSRVPLPMPERSPTGPSRELLMKVAPGLVNPEIKLDLNDPHALMREAIAQNEPYRLRPDGTIEAAGTLQRKVRETIEGKPIDWNGHYGSGKYLYNATLHAKRSFFHPGQDLTQENAEDLVAAINRGEALDRFVLLSKPTCLTQCSECGEDLGLETDGEALRATGPCIYPEGLPSSVWELNVPSGKLVVDNDLRSFFPSGEDHNINLNLGIHLSQLAYAAVGMSHGFVGNSCPGVYRLDDKHYKVACPPYDEDDEINEAFEGESVAGVCTDLWWYSIVDHAELLRRVNYYQGKDLDELPKDWDVAVVEVPPGVYQFTQFTYHNRKGIEGEERYCEFEWVRDPDPLIDYIAREETATVTPSQNLIASILEYPSLYAWDLPWESLSEEGKTLALANAANQLMCTGGNGIGWHENGHPRGRVAEEEMEIPAFNFQSNWYPFTDSSELAVSAGVGKDAAWVSPIKYNADFCKLALNICQSIISHGIAPSFRLTPKQQKAETLQRLRLTVKIYRGLRKLYPEVVFDKEFDQWMENKKYVNAWVRRKELAPYHPPVKKIQLPKGYRPPVEKTQLPKAPSV